MELQAQNTKLLVIGRGRHAASPASPLLAISPEPTQIVRSSSSLSWHGLVLEKHFSLPGERASACMDRHVISMLCGPSSRFERRTASGHLVAYLDRPGTITIAPPGSLPEIQFHTPSEFIHCAFEPDFIHRVIEELDRQPVPRPMFRSGIQDQSIQHILGMLMEELETDRPMGRLYVDSLAHALATRYLQLPGASGMGSESRASTPHQYVSGLRLSRSRAHTTSVFRQRVRMTPAEFRRNA
jgi:AraC-like ligand binding domain